MSDKLYVTAWLYDPAGWTKEARRVVDFRVPPAYAVTREVLHRSRTNVGFGWFVRRGAADADKPWISMTLQVDAKSWHRCELGFHIDGFAGGGWCYLTVPGFVAEHIVKWASGVERDSPLPLFDLLAEQAEWPPAVPGLPLLLVDCARHILAGLVPVVDPAVVDGYYRGPTEWVAAEENP